MNYKFSTILLSIALVGSIAFYAFSVGSARHGAGHHKASHDMTMMNMTMSDMLAMMEGRTGKDLEREFMLGMIPHHQGAIDMATLLLQDKTVSPQLQKFANDIITAQEGEITMMNEWLQAY